MDHCRHKILSACHLYVYKISMDAMTQLRITKAHPTLYQTPPSRQPHCPVSVCRFRNLGFTVELTDTLWKCA